jgi:histidinol-phosphatase (PHP family)
LIDYHIHEYHSRDTIHAKIPNFIKEAEKKGLDEIAFTTHLIVSSPDVVVSIRNDEIQEYVEEIRAAQESTKVKLLVGLEVDYFPEEERKLERILNDYDFDIILGSTHYINGLDIGKRSVAEEFFSGRPLSKGVDEYFTVWKRAIESGLFDVMAHPDYWRKYVHLFRSKPTWQEYGEVVYDALESLVDHKVGIEVNTSGLRHGVGSFFPIQEFLISAREAGVDIITVGSDSHEPSSIGFGFNDACNQLKMAGFKGLSLFRNRKSEVVKFNYLIRSNTQNKII